MPQGYPDASIHVTPARERLSAATRALADLVMTADHASDADLDAAAARVEALSTALRLGAPGAVPGGVPGGGPGGGPGAAGLRRVPERRYGDYLPRSPLVGSVSPVSPGATWEFLDGRLDLRVTFGSLYEGPPGYVHGGFVALAFDELLGMATVLSGQGGLTGRLSVRYRRPTPLHRELRCTAWVEHREGRRMTAKGTIHAGDDLTAEAEGLFVTVGAERALEYFGAPAPFGVNPGAPGGPR